MKVVIVTGGSSGIGLACCKKFLQNGYTVYELSRKDTQHNDGIIHISADVTDETGVEEAMNTVFKNEGRIDLLVNNAGFGIAGSIENTAVADAKKQFDVNFFGTVLCTQKVLPFMRKQGFGRIINISSMAAPLAIPFQSFYSASKAAVNSFTLSLANEVKPFGITVCAVMPGDVKTGFTAAREKSKTETVYGDVLSRSLAVMEKDEQNGMPPDAIADAVYKAACAKKPKPLSTKGLQYRVFAVLSKSLPTGIVNRIVGMIYAK